MNKKVSIIVPIFNGAEHIHNIFNVLDAQSYDNFETVFVVDKKTTDNTLELIRSNKKDRTDIKLLIQTNDDMLGGARNQGLNESDGEIIWFMDADDYPIGEDMLSYTVSVMEENNADVVMFNSIRTFSTDLQLSTDKKYNIKTMNRNEAVIALADLKLPVTAWSKIMRRDILVDNGVEFISGYAEDVDHTYHTLNVAKKICYCERPLYAYVQNKNSICNSGKNNNSRGLAEIRVYTSVEELFSNDEDLAPYLKKRTALMRIRSAVHMDKTRFMSYVKSDECQNMMKENLSLLSPEVVIFRLVPSIYYWAVNFYLDHFYYSDNRLFSKPGRAK